MTDQQKKAVEEAAEAQHLGVTGFIRGAEEVLNNPEKYGLVPFEDYKEAVKERRDANEGFRAERKESARLRSCLRTIETWTEEMGYEYDDIACLVQEVLKGGDTK